MLTIIYPFKNREKERVIKSLTSIYNQDNKEFNVVFVDYGSDNPIDFSSFFPSLKYVYLDVRNQPWNKSKAINYALKNELTTPYFFISDVDMIYKNNFVDTIYSLIPHHNVFYFQVAYLKEELSDSTSVFDANNVIKVSNYQATGMTVFQTDIVKELKGFDEFFHFWGSECKFQ